MLQTMLQTTCPQKTTKVFRIIKRQNLSLLNDRKSICEFLINLDDLLKKQYANS